MHCTVNLTKTHFSRISPKYTALRTTDIQPVLVIEEQLGGDEQIVAADVGCGAGRYDQKILQCLGDRLTLFCMDANRDMLRQLQQNLLLQGARNFHAVEGNAEQLPFSTRSLDSLFTFNAIHLFPIGSFLMEASRTLKNNGFLFIYTRFRSQNERNIWGRWFPSFSTKEQRLYEQHELEEIIKSRKGLEVESVKCFHYKRSSTLQNLLWKAKNHHYSTFDFYTEKEFEESLRRFQQNIQSRFDPSNVTWEDENVLYAIRNTV